jgi:acyl-CoA synthetase (AMP-forming)/AMP-acid ligase II
MGGIQSLLRSVVIGGTLVLPAQRFDPGEALELMERWKITRWSAVPTMATRLLEHPDVHRRDLRSLRSMTLGGAPVYSELVQQIRTGLPGIEARVTTGYGLTENGGQATAASHIETTERPGSSGRALPCVELKIFPQPGLPDGEILIRSCTQMTGYYGEADDSPIDESGWLHTGDLGRIDADGYLFITGRCKDLIIRGGENIAPAAVERALVAVPGVAEAVVFGLPHAVLGEEVAAVVVVEGDLTPEIIQAELRSRLASFAAPSRWWLRKEPLPVNHTGKIDKPAVVAEIQAEIRAELARAGENR